MPGAIRFTVNVVHTKNWKECVIPVVDDPKDSIANVKMVTKPAKHVKMGLRRKLVLHRWH